MKLPSHLSPLSALLLLLGATTSGASGEGTPSDEAPPQCYGLTPQPSLTSFLGAELDYPTAERICCNNHKYAEYRGYLTAPEVDLFGRLDPTKEHVFYDSVCGLPLFIAPRGRTFEEFKQESIDHGWPSFRPAEIISENVVIHWDGRLESKCLTHLGHNLPRGGADRYCVDLVCIAGQPLAADDARVQVLTDANVLDGTDTLDSDSNVITADELDVDTYVSSAQAWSGKYNDAGRKWLISVLTVVGVLLVLGLGFYLAARCGNNNKNNNGKEEEKSVETGSNHDLEEDHHQQQDDSATAAKEDEVKNTASPEGPQP